MLTTPRVVAAHTGHKRLSSSRLSTRHRSSPALRPQGTDPGMLQVALGRRAHQPFRALHGARVHCALLPPSDPLSPKTLPKNHLGLHLRAHCFRHLRFHHLFHPMHSDPEGLAAEHARQVSVGCCVCRGALVLSGSQHLVRRSARQHPVFDVQVIEPAETDEDWGYHSVWFGCFVSHLCSSPHFSSCTFIRVGGRETRLRI